MSKYQTTNFFHAKSNLSIETQTTLTKSYVSWAKSDTEEEAAEAYDLAAIDLRGVHAVTNFDISNYCNGGNKRVEEPCKLEL